MTNLSARPSIDTSFSYAWTKMGHSTFKKFRHTWIKSRKKGRTTIVHSLIQPNRFEKTSSHENTFTGIALRSQDIKGIIPVPLRRVRTTRSSTDPHPFQVSPPIHELYPTNHHSSKKYAIYGMSCFLLAFLNLRTCHLSNIIDSYSFITLRRVKAMVA